jgi:cell division GTPase FtsZ
MASKVSNLRQSLPKSMFYGDEKHLKTENKVSEMSDNFYDEAAKEVIKDVAEEKKPSASNTTQADTQETPEATTQAEESERGPDIVAHVPPVPSQVTLDPVAQQALSAPAPALVPDTQSPQQPESSVSVDDYGIGEYDDFDFVEAYDDEPVSNDQMLPENTAPSAVKCAFLGVGGGGGKLAKAFLDLGFSKTLLINTTPKDQPAGIPEEHFLLLPGADGVGKDIALGKTVLENNGALVEDTLRTRLGQVDWLFVIAGGGGGTGSACHILQDSLERYLKSVGGKGRVVYILTKPTSQELLNPTIQANYESLLSDVALHAHILIDNEKQLQLLRGKVGILGMYPAANKNFAKLLHQVLKLASENSPVQSFDSKDLERVLGTTGRMVIGSTVSRDVTKPDLGASLYQGCLRSSPCPNPAGKASTGVMLLIVTPQMASDPNISKNLEAAFSYVGGRTDTLFSGIYVKQPLPGLIAISVIGGF